MGRKRKDEERLGEVSKSGIIRGTASAHDISWEDLGPVKRWVTPEKLLRNRLEQTCKRHGKGMVASFYVSLHLFYCL